MSKMTKRKLKHRKIEYPVTFSKAEIRLFFDNVETLRDVTLFLLVYSCGLNIHDVLNIRPQDIQGKGDSYKRIKIGYKKYREERSVILPETTYKSLQAYWLTHQNTELLFPQAGKSNTQVAQSVCAISKAFKETVERAGLKKDKVGINTLRYSRMLHLRQIGDYHE